MFVGFGGLNMIKIEDLNIFIKDTSAVATNRGFLYQYLHTLEEWINLYISKSDAAIYCEYEDDITIDEDRAMTFKQVKCYSEELNLNSSATKKTLYNCFILYLKYASTNKETNFYLISNVKSQDEILINWELYKQKVFIGYETETVEKVKGLIINHVEIKKQKSLKDKRFKTKESIEKHEEEVNRQYDIIMDSINNTDWSDFCSKVTFSSNNDSVEIIKGMVSKKISNINSTVPEKLVFARLLQIIIEESSKEFLDKNKLNYILIDCILKETEEEMKEKVNSNYADFKDLYDELIGPDLKQITNVVETNIELTKQTHKNTEEIKKLILNIIDNKVIGTQNAIGNVSNVNNIINDSSLHNGDLTCDKLFEIVEERIDAFIDNGEYAEAKKIIEKIKDSKTCSNYPVYFVDSLKQKLGIIFLNSGNIEGAKQILADLVKSSTRTKNICNFMITMAAISKDDELKNIAMERLKEMEEGEESTNLALCKYYNILGELEKGLEILTYNNAIRDGYKENALALELLADMYFRAGNYSEAANYFGQSDMLRPNWYKRFRRILSETNSIISGIGSLYLLTDEQKYILLSRYKELETIEEQFSEVYLEERAIYFNLKLILLLFANPNEFEEVYNNLDKEIKEFDTIRVTYADYISICKEDDAIDIYEEVFKRSNDMELLRKILLGLSKRKKHSDLIKVLEDYGYKSFDKDGIMAELYIESIKYDKGLDYAINKYNELKDRFDDCPFFHRIALVLFFEKGLYDDLNNVAGSLKKSIKDDNYMPRYVFSETLENVGLIDESIEIIKPLINYTFKARKRYIFLLAKTNVSENIQNALGLINELITQKRCDSELFCLKGQILFEKDQEEALTSYLKSFETKPTVVSATNSLSLALAVNKLNDIDNIIRFMEQQLKPVCATMLSKYYSKMGQKSISEYYSIKSLSLLRDEFDEDVYGQLVISAFSDNNDEEKIEFDKVENNTAVELIDDAEKSIWVCIHSEKGLVSEEGIQFGGCFNYSPASKQYLYLKNRKKNDVVEISGKHYRVNSIFSRKYKFVNYCREMFSAKYPDHPYFKTLNVSSDDVISPILPFLVKQKERREFLLRQYNFETGIGLPLYAFSDKDYSKHIDSILNLMSAKNQIFYAGEPRAVIFNNKAKIVITYSSLLIINYLKKLDKLKTIKENIILPKSMEVEVMSAFEHSEKFDTRTSGTMGLNEEGKPVFLELTEEQKNNRLSFWRELALFIKDIKLVDIEKNIDSDQANLISELIGKVDFESVILTINEKAVLISDDLFVKKYATSLDSNCASSNIIKVLFQILDDEEELLDCLLLLSKGNYLMLYSQEILIDLFERIKKHPTVFGEGTIWGKVKQLLRNSLSLPDLFKVYIPILLDVFEYFYRSISFECKDMFVGLIIEEIKYANRIMKINDSVFFNIIQKRFGLESIKFNFFVKLYSQS